MPRYKLTIEYDGHGFVGWQRQANGPSVQETLEAALAPLAGGPVTLLAAGRTDAGVHALGQVAHLDLEREREPNEVRDSANHHLAAAGVAVLAAERVGDDFHARFSATRRRYLYRIVNRRARLALDRHRAWHVAVALDAPAMHEAAQRLVGRHDFTTFRSSQCQAASATKTLDMFGVERQGEDILIRAAARSFLHHQVRSMVGSLKLVGEGRWRGDDIAAALVAADRKRCGPVAPPDGLYLAGVDYDSAG